MAKTYTIGHLARAVEKRIYRQTNQRLTKPESHPG